MSNDTRVARERRIIVHADALVWLRENPAPPDASVITSLPDVSELALPPAGERSADQDRLEAWRSWFVDAARAVIRWLPARGMAIFYQSDIRHRGEWIDKGFLVQSAAASEGALLLWHKIVCRRPPGTIALGRPSYSHMLCVTRERREVLRRPGPDVIPDAGFVPWTRAMGVAAGRIACRFLIEETSARVVVDPFCGKGTVLAVANQMGLDAIGVDISAKRCRAARALRIPDETS